MKKVNTAFRLKTLMDERNLKQIDILKACEPYCKKYDVKMNKSDISQYVSGKVEPNQKKLYILSNALNVREAWLMGYDVPIERTPSESLDKKGHLGAILLSNTKFMDFFSQFVELSDEGQDKVIEYTKDLFPKYKKEW